MSTLKNRIVNVQQNASNLHVVGQYNTPEVMPNMRIAIYPGYVTYETLTPLYTSDGDLYAATGLGEWNQLYAAGRT